MMYQQTDTVINHYFCSVFMQIPLMQICVRAWSQTGRGIGRQQGVQPYEDRWPHTNG